MSLTVTINRTAGKFYEYRRSVVDTWVNVVAGNGTIASNLTPEIRAQESAGTRICIRTGVHFFTQTYTCPTSAILYVYNRVPASGTNNQLQLCTWTPSGDFDATTGFEDIYTSMADTDTYGGSMTIADIGDVDWWRSPDLVAAGIYSASATFNLALFNDYWDNFLTPVDPVSTNNVIDLSTSNIPYLSLTLDPELAIYSTLVNDKDVSDIVGARVYPIVRSQGASLPAVTYQRISTPRIRGLDGRAGLQSPRFQINCWAETYTVAVKLGHMVGKALDDLSATVGGLPIQAVDLDDEDDLEEISPGNRKDRIFGRRLDFIIWAREDT